MAQPTRYYLKHVLVGAKVRLYATALQYTL
jgi:hypothetical protein